jgi:hypothetical protein
MASLFKYLFGLVVLLFSAFFLSYESVDMTLAAITPQWKVERLKAAPDTPYIAQGSLSPLYPAAPGKELLGKPVWTAARVSKHHEVASAKPVVKPVNTKRLDVSQALRAHKLPRKIFARVEPVRNYSQRSYGYAEEPQAQSRTFNVLAHDLY